MKDSIIKSYEELPLFLSAQMVADVLMRVCGHG